MLEQATKSSTLEGIAAILSAVAWPLVASACLFTQRRRIAEFLVVLTAKITTAKHIKAGGIELAEDLIDSAVERSPAGSEKAIVPQKQVDSAKDLQSKLQSAGVDRSEAALTAADRIHALSLQYEEIRRSSESSHARTTAMDQVVAKMRTLALLAKPLLPRLTRSSLAGERLAAIAALQVEPSPNYSRWLAERMSVEAPFVFFHAAMALRQLAAEGRIDDQEKLKGEIEAALKTIVNYTGGQPDENTIEVLQDALSRCKQPL